MADAATETTVVAVALRRPYAVDGGRAWLVMAAGFVASAIVFGTPTVTGLFFMPLLHEFHLQPHTVASMVGFTPILLCTSGVLGSVLYGVLGPSRTLLLGGCLMSASMASFTVVQQPATATALFILIGIGCGISSGVIIPIQSEYFVRHLRPAMAMASVGSASGAMLLSPLAVHLIDEFGWRNAWLILAAVTLHLLPCAMLFKSNNPPTKAVERREVLDVRLLCRPLFGWFTSVAVLPYSAAVIFFAMFPALLAGNGFGSSVVGSLLCLVGLCAIAGRLAAAVLAYASLAANGNLIIGVSCVVWSAQLALLSNCQDFTHMTIFCGLFGCFQGLHWAFIPVTLQELFGERHRLYSVVGIFFTLIGLLTLPVPSLFGHLVESSGVQTAFVVAGGCGLLSAGCHLATALCVAINRHSKPSRSHSDDDSLI